MILLGLTGSIGMGKSETAKMFRSLGVPVWDADAAVHALYAEGGAAVGPIGAAFPGTVVGGAVDRQALTRAIAGDATRWRTLEQIVHPLVGAGQAAFLEAARAGGHRLVVLDIPLLFETGGERRVDYVVVVSAPAPLQRARVLERPGMTAEKLDEILAKQVPDAVKREKADFVVPTDQGLEPALRHVREIVRILSEAPPPRRPDRRPETKA
jgi:dephospho-CoA kinase